MLTCPKAATVLGWNLDFSELVAHIDWWNEGWTRNGGTRMISSTKGWANLQPEFQRWIGNSRVSPDFSCSPWKNILFIQFKLFCHVFPTTLGNKLNSWRDAIAPDPFLPSLQTPTQRGVLQRLRSPWSFHSTVILCWFNGSPKALMPMLPTNSCRRCVRWGWKIPRDQWKCKGKREDLSDERWGETIFVWLM